MTISLLRTSNNDMEEIKEVRKIVFNNELKIPESY